MKKLIAISIVLGLTVSVRALPMYDNFSTYGTAGTWAETSSGIPTISYPTGAPVLGGNIAPSGESWIVYTNVTTANLYSTVYASDSWPGINNQNVSVVNYFAGGQPGASDTAAPSLPTGYPGPFVAGHDTSANSVWTPGWGQTGLVSPVNYLGGVGACLKFASPVTGAGNKVFASFFVDVPDCTASFGAGQSLDHGFNAGFLDAAELPSPNSSSGQNVIPSIFEKFNIRDVSTSTWHPGIGDTAANAFSVTQTASSQKSVHFIVISYEFNGATGGTTDEERIWIDPTKTFFGAAAEPLTGLPTGTTVFRNPTAGDELPDASGFFFLGYTQDGGGTPNSGVLFNSLSVGTSWAYVTGGAQFTTNEPYAETSAGQTLVLNPSAAAGGGVSCNYSWANSSGPLTLGGHYTVNAATGALTIANVQASDADTYTLSVSTPITTENGVAPITAPTLVIVFTSQTMAGSAFTMNFTGPTGSPYRIWYSTDETLQPVFSNWNLATGPGASGNFVSGGNTYTDTAASSTTGYYTITSP